LSPDSYDNSFAQNVLGAIYRENGDYEKGMHAHEKALSFISEDSKASRSETLTYLAQAQTSFAWRISDGTLHQTGLENFQRAIDLCRITGITYDCYLAHDGIGTASLNWTSLPVSAQGRVPEIEKAISEFELACTFLSKSEQPQLYATERKWQAVANIRRSIQEDERAGRRPFLNAALSELTEAIEVLSTAGLDPGELYRERSKCYVRLKENAADDKSKNEYARLAAEDSDTAKELLENKPTNQVLETVLVEPPRP
jgi:tetratricopeptide (TPR) repeat protein